MTRYAVFSDVHGNYEALQAFLEHSKKQQIDQYLCCGDVVGYGANPVECLDEVFSLCRNPDSGELFVIQGNHEESAAKYDVEDMNPHAARALLWTHNQLEDNYLDDIAQLPLTLEIGADILLVHGSPQSPHLWKYLSTVEDVEDAVEHFDRKLCFVGHSHIPFFTQTSEDGDPRLLRNDKVEVSDERQHLVNVGSVGQPRDRDPRGCYVVYDSKEKTLERFRFEYDIATAQKKILDAGLPEFLALRLESGF